MNLTINPRTTSRLLALAAAGLTALCGVSMYLYATIDHAAHRGLAELLRKFLLDGELTVPAWFTSVMLFGAGLLLVVIGWAERSRGGQYARHWAALAIVFALMSMDEMAGMHEMFITPVRRRLGVSGVFHYAWVIPALMFLGAMAVAYFRFVLFHLPKETRRWITFAGVVYVGGALGMEMAEGVIDPRWGKDSLAGRAAVAVEESMEMAGVVIFLYGLMNHIAMYVGEIRLVFGTRASRESVMESDDALRALQACVEQELARANAASHVPSVDCSGTSGESRHYERRVLTAFVSQESDR
jgi:hypothetical protein